MCTKLIISCWKLAACCENCCGQNLLCRDVRKSRRKTAVMHPRRRGKCPHLKLPFVVSFSWSVVLSCQHQLSWRILVNVYHPWIQGLVSLVLHPNNWEFPQTAPIIGFLLHHHSCSGRCWQQLTGLLQASSLFLPYSLHAPREGVAFAECTCSLQALDTAEELLVSMFDITK